MPKKQIIAGPKDRPSQLLDGTPSVRNQTHHFHNEMDVGIETVSDLAVLVRDFSMVGCLFISQC